MQLLELLLPRGPNGYEQHMGLRMLCRGLGTEAGFEERQGHCTRSWQVAASLVVAVYASIPGT